MTFPCNAFDNSSDLSCCFEVAVVFLFFCNFLCQYACNFAKSLIDYRRDWIEIARWGHIEESRVDQLYAFRKQCGESLEKQVAPLKSKEVHFETRRWTHEYVETGGVK